MNAARGYSSISLKREKLKHVKQDINLLAHFMFGVQNFKLMKKSWVVVKIFAVHQIHNYVDKDKLGGSGTLHHGI